MSLYARKAFGSTPVRHVPDREQFSEIDAEAWVLGTEPGQALLAEVSHVRRPGPADISRWRKQASAPAVAAAMRLAACRARAKAKFTRGDRMWLDPVGLQQATSEAVARHKAARFGGQVVVDLCAGIGGDALALGKRAHVLAADLDHGMCRRIAWNAAVYEVDGRVLPCQSRAETFPIPPEAWVHIDPDRRASGQKRSLNLQGYVPGLGFLHALSRCVPGGAIKLGPASDFANRFSSTGFEIELISERGECKEATAWFGAAVTCRRRATRLPEDVTWTDQDGVLGEGAMVPVTGISSFLYDPDPSLLRSGLLDSFASARGLSRIAADLEYLTADRLIATPFLSAFEVRSVHPLDLKRLRRLVQEQNLGPMEIKVRGLDIVPETLRKQLRPLGSQPVALILAGGAGATRAVLANRLFPS